MNPSKFPVVCCRSRLVRPWLLQTIVFMASVAICTTTLNCTSKPPNHPAGPSSNPLSQQAQLQQFESDDTTLEMACLPSGFEICFDAIDNNCNGIIDEGCGIRTGFIQFSIAWSDAQADVDLKVTDPNGEQTRHNQATKTGLLKDRDCPGENQECHGQNTENIYLVSEKVTPGMYVVQVHLHRLGTDALPLRVQFGARVGQRSYRSVLQLEQLEATVEMRFTI